MIKAKISIPLVTKYLSVKLWVLMVLSGGAIQATNDPIVLTKSYVGIFAEEAVEQMIRYRIPASVILAQAIFESNCGQSALAKKSNNHFGIKCHLAWRGDTVVKTDDTFNECFRKYNSIEESYTDHSLFLKSRARYSFLFDLSITDYKGWCKGLKSAGYATFPGYAEELISIIEENKLYLYDKSEYVESEIKLNTKDQIINSKYVTGYFSIKDLVKCDALFTNERDVLIQSLDLVTEPVTEVLEDIVEK